MQAISVKALTVGALRAALVDLPDTTEIVIDTDGWYDNVQAVIVPSIATDHVDYVAVTLIPATPSANGNGNWDARQKGLTQPAEITRCHPYGG